MNFKSAVECFRFAFGLLVFILPENFLTRVTCIHVFEKPLGQWDELAFEKPKVAERNPVNNFELEPFESVEDDFYKSGPFLNAVDEDSRKMLEKMTKVSEIDSREMLRKKAGDDQARSFSERKEIINSRVYQRNSFKQARIRNLSQDWNLSSTSYKSLREDINKMKLQIKNLIKMFRAMSNLQEVENSSLDYLVKVPEVFKPEQEEGLNKAAINNRFQIDSIFFINALSKEDSRKKADAKLASLTEVLNNLKEETAFSDIPANPPTISYFTTKPYDLDLMKQLQKFTKIFDNQDVTLDQINQISKIVNFVERYHGLVGNLKSLDFSGEEIMRRMKE